MRGSNISKGDEDNSDIIGSGNARGPDCTRILQCSNVRDGKEEERGENGTILELDFGNHKYKS